MVSTSAAVVTSSRYSAKIAGSGCCRSLRGTWRSGFNSCRRMKVYCATDIRWPGHILAIYKHSSIYTFRLRITDTRWHLLSAASYQLVMFSCWLSTYDLFCSMSDRAVHMSNLIVKGVSVLTFCLSDSKLV